MKPINLHRVALAAVIAACAAFGTGCYDDAQVQVGEPVAAYGYQPQYYNSAVVYYDEGGRPFYHDASGAVAWVPQESPYYGGYVNHWRSYGGAYRRWYSGYGYRYHRYYRRHWR
jgi:hypothetical protein